MIGHGYGPGGNLSFLRLWCNIQQEKKNTKVAVNPMAAVAAPPLLAIIIAGTGKA
jgi:hypothetical protein